MRIILGSSSESRKKVLEKAGYVFSVMTADIDEKAIRFEDPVMLTLALARAKAEAIIPRISGSALLITSDQVVVYWGSILEKPTTSNEALTFLRRYRYFPAETVTSVVVTNVGDGRRAEGTDIAKIWFHPIPDVVIRKYIENGDPFKHAGGFDHEHKLMKPYINRIEGESDSIAGLPLGLTRRLLAEYGL